MQVMPCERPLNYSCSLVTLTTGENMGPSVKFLGIARTAPLAAATALALLVSTTATNAQDPGPDSPDPKVVAINKKYEAEYAKLQKQGEELSKKSPQGAENAVGFDIDFSKQKDVSFDVPEFRMKRQKAVLELPSLTMKIQRVVWDNPETKMVPKKVGQYPEVHGWTVKWKDIITHVPEVRMVRREAKLHLPEFHTSRTELIFDVPEVFKTTRVQFKIPEIKIRTTEQGKQEVKEGAEQLSGAASTLASAQKAELMEFSRQRLVAQKTSLESQRKQAIGQISDAIAQVRKAGIDPSAVPQENGTPLNLLAQLQQIEARFGDAIAQIDAAVKQLQA